MDHLQSSSEETRKFPVKTFLVAVVVFAAAAAILVFKVPWTTVLFYGFFGLMLSSHFFMHGGHGSHNHGVSPNESGQSPTDRNTLQISPHNQAVGPSQTDDLKAQSDKNQDSHQGHSGCC